ncbi:hypothetical protein [Pleomorphovibrio marinus]|uniref:hypothetical protein n=1 Tax=Pleomorphovibrio marinus TaxID=2164132 RepID=UPI000E0C653A|nr:hypothetical protein [Pleomorphovibrio marinus]
MKRLVNLGLDESYLEGYHDNLRNLDVKTLMGTAREFLHSNQIHWLIIGDKSNYLKALQELGLAEIEEILVE